MKIFFTKMLDTNELISSFNKPVNHYKQGNVCEVNEVNGQVKWQMSNFSVYYWKTERQALLATRIFLLFGGIFCHFLFLAVKQGIQITFFHGIYINKYWDLENIFHKWDETNTCCNKTTSLLTSKTAELKAWVQIKDLHMIFLNSFNKSVYFSPVMEHLLYRELLKRAQHLIWTEAIFLVIINIMWPSLVTFLFPM